MDEAQEQFYVARIVRYMEKAMREAKVYTSWLTPSEPHERAMTRFVEMVLAADNTAFRQDLEEFCRRIATFGIYNALSQLAIKVAAPGVPDFYQGTELWDFSLVDPDNRRPVDYERRRALLAELDGFEGAGGAALPGSRLTLAGRLMSDISDDRLKLYVTAALLRFRRAHRDLFAEGDYTPLSGEGPRRDHLFAFARRLGERHVVVTVPRLVATLSPDGAAPLGERVWGETCLRLGGFAAGAYRDVLSGAEVTLVRNGSAAYLKASDMFAAFPIAFLETA